MTEPGLCRLFTNPQHAQVRESSPPVGGARAHGCMVRSIPSEIWEACSGRRRGRDAVYVKGRFQLLRSCCFFLSSFFFRSRASAGRSTFPVPSTPLGSARRVLM